jgi:hypothetical protein
MKYRVSAARLNVRLVAGSTAAVVEKLPKNAEISVEREIEMGGAIWGRLTRGGWVCIRDGASRYCVEIPQPVPAEQPGQPAPDYETRLAALEAKVDRLIEQVSNEK